MIQEISILKSSISILHSKYNDIITRMKEAHTIEMEQNSKIFSLTIQEKEESMKQIIANLSSSKANEHSIGNFIGTKLLIESSRNSNNLASNASTFLEEFRIKQDRLKHESANIRSEINQVLCNLSHFNLINQDLQGNRNIKYLNIFEDESAKNSNREKINPNIKNNNTIKASEDIEEKQSKQKERGRPNQSIGHNINKKSKEDENEDEELEEDN